jgi:hypothetical protein
MFITDPAIRHVLTRPKQPEIIGDVTFRAGGLWANVSSLTQTHTVVPGTEMLLVFVHFRAAAASRTITSVTWNGVTMTEFVDLQDDGNRSGMGVLWLRNPTPAAAANLIVTMSGACSGLAQTAVNLIHTSHATAPLILLDSLNANASVTDYDLEGVKRQRHSLVFFGSSWTNTTATSGGPNLTWTPTGWIELCDTSDTNSDGCQAGLAYNPFALDGHILSNIATIESSMVPTGVLVEVLGR